jgi:hypothetical protein
MGVQKGAFSLEIGWRRRGRAVGKNGSLMLKKVRELRKNRRLMMKKRERMLKKWGLLMKEQ